MKRTTKKKVLNSIILLSLIAQPINTFAYTKNETVYANLNNNGTVKEVTVNNHLSELNKEKIEDETILTKIINLNGDEEYTKTNNNLIWNATGKDIFYQGKTKESLPISISIDYYLNGEKTSPKKMLNKEGNITIKIHLENKSYHPNKKLHTPFIVTSGIIFDSKKDTDIKITNGSVTETGTRSTAIAIAAPGLYDDIKIKELKELDEITINYNTTNFTLNNIYLVATPKLLEKIDITNFNKVNTLDNSIKTIQDNMNKIDLGAKTLNDASLKINNGSTEIANNLNTALQAIKKLEIGSFSLDNGLKEAITSLEQAKNLLENKDITGSLANIETLIKTNTITITSLENTNLTLKTTYDTYQLNKFNSDQDLITYFLNQNLSQETINNLLTCKKTYEGNQNLIKLLSTNNFTLKTLTKSLQETYESISSLLVKFEEGLIKLEKGSFELSKGLQQVNTGLEKLYSGTTTLTEGTNNLKVGTNTLSTGITELNQKGINKLTEKSTILTSYSNKIKELINLSETYKGYSSTNNNKTTFIYKVKSIQ